MEKGGGENAQSWQRSVISLFLPGGFETCVCARQVGETKDGALVFRCRRACGVMSCWSPSISAGRAAQWSGGAWGGHRRGAGP